MNRHTIAALLLVLMLADGLAAPEPDLATRTLSRLVRALEDPDRGVRYAAVQALGKAGAAPAVLAGRLRDPAWCVQREAGWWLRRGGPGALRYVENVLVSGTEQERATAAWTLSGCGAAAVPALARALADPADEVRLEALAALRRLGTVAGSAAKGVRERLGAETLKERYEAALTLVVIAPAMGEAAAPVLLERVRKMRRPTYEGLGALLRAGEAGERALSEMVNSNKDLKRRVDYLRTSPEAAEIGPTTRSPRGRIDGRRRPVPLPVEKPAVAATPELLANLASPDVRVRLRAALDLGEAGADAKHLAPLLADPERDVRIAAALALGGAGGDAVAPLVSALLDPNPRVRRAALVSLGKRHAAGAEVAALLADDNLAISDAAFRALLVTGIDVAEAVAKVLGSGSYAAVRYAPFVFQSLGPRGAPAAKTLAGLLSHEDVNVREAAARCLYSIGSPEAAPSLVRALGDERLCVVSHAALALGATGLGDDLIKALDDPRARVRAYAAFAAGWALGATRGVDQVPFEVRLPVLDAGREVKSPTLAEVEAVVKGEPAERVPVLRRAMWSSDPRIALKGAAGLTYEDLDATESERAMEVLLPEGQRRGNEVDFDELRSIIGSSELPACMMYLTRASRCWPARASVFGHFHRIARADEIPALEWFGRNEEQEALQGWDEIWQPDHHSDRYARERAASMTGVDPGPDERAVLRAFLRHRLDKGPPGLWPPEIWLLNGYEPVEEDAELLLATARSLDRPEDEINLPAVIRALGKLGDVASEAWLRERAEKEDEDEPHALAALARRGDEKALEALVERCRSSGSVTPLALLIEIRPRRGVDLLVEGLCDPENDVLWRGATDLVDDVTPAVWSGVRWPEEACLGLEPALAAAPPPASVLGAIATGTPLCRTRRMAARLFEALSPERAPAWWVNRWSEPVDGGPVYGEDWVGDPDAIAAFLFSVDPDRTRVLLRGWADVPIPEVREWARRALVLAGDAASAKRILAWMGPKGAVRDYVQDRVLGRSDCEEIRGHLRLWATEAPDEYEGQEALVMLALLQGWPTYLPLDPPEEPGKAWQAVKEGILAGRIDDALAAWPWSRWIADDQIDPGEAPVWERIGRRALAGDRKARAAFWSAMRAGRYRWVHYNFGGDTHTLGRDPQVLPHWLADMDSNCCRISDGMAYDVFGDPFLEPQGWGNHSLYDANDSGIGRPPSRYALDLFRMTGGEWMWSPIQDDGSIGRTAATRQAMIPVPE
jgi:HEAT repeat protein